MEGKKKKRGGLLIAKPDCKKAYVTLRSPLSVSSELYPIRIIEEDRRSMTKESKSKPSIVEQAEVRSHWLDDGGGRFKPEKGSGDGSRCRGGNHGFDVGAGEPKFPWSSMRASR